MWKAIITSKSDIDQTSNLTLTFDIYIDDKSIYPNQVISTTPDTYEDQIKVILSKLKMSSDASVGIKVGEEIILNV